ncbi:MAG: hypothetical protein L7F77_00510 [Candidatus Magnetominusculus sp. LBB02]|nr:hypothetical protein [Candidatus Magnetominusculus sp. LBB02]
MRVHLVQRQIALLLLVMLLPVAAFGSPWYFPPAGDKHWTDTYGEISTSLVFGDINADGKDEIIFGTKKGYIVAINSNGKKPHAIKIGESIKADPILLDLKKSGHPDIVAFAKLAGYDKAAEKSVVAVIDGRTFTKRTEAAVQGSIVSKPAIADFDNDGNVDILVSARGLFLIDGKGLTKNAPLDVYPFEINGTVYSSAVVEDLSDDGKNDFIIPYTYKDKHYLQVFLSTANGFTFDQVTLPIANELRVAPTLIKGQESKDNVTWRIVCPSHNKTVDFYTLTVHAGKSLSIKPDIIYKGLQHNLTEQMPAFCSGASDCSLYLNISETGAIWKIGAASFDKKPLSSGIRLYEHIPFYIRKSIDNQYIPMILAEDNNTLYAIEDGIKNKLAQYDQPIPQLDKIYLFKTAEGQYALTGITDDKQIYFSASPTIKLSLQSPNAPDYFNQAVLPPPQMEYLLTELRNSLQSHNDNRSDILSSIALELYPGDHYFRQTLKQFKQSIKQEAALLSNVTSVKRDLMEMVSRYDYPALVQFVLYRDVEKKLEYVLKQDPEFLEEPGVADFYKKAKMVRSIINAFIPLAGGIFILTVVILLLFNYPLFIRLFYVVFFWFRENNKWKRLTAAAPQEIAAYLNNAGMLANPPTQSWDFSFRILLRRLVKEDTLQWRNCLYLYENNVTNGIALSEAERRRFYRYILNLYKRLFYLRLAHVSLYGWIAFQIRHIFQKDYYDIKTKDRHLCALKFELARAFLNVNEFKPAFNYLHKLILAGYEGGADSEEMDYMDRLPEHKIENYFLNFSNHFFSRVTALKDQIGILTAYRAKQLPFRVDLLINTRLKDCLSRRGFPMVVVSDYALMGLHRDHGLFITLSAYNQAKKTDALLRCIPHNHINIADDTDFNALPDGFTRILNVHRSQKWIVQVEPLISAPSLKALGRTGIPPHKARDILAAAIKLLSAARPLRFIPNLHPSHVFWDNSRVFFAGNGLSKPHIDREIILHSRKYKTAFKTEWFVTPEFFDNPSPQKILENEDLTEKTIVYYLGLLLYWMLEGRFPFSGIPAATPVRLSTFNEAQGLIDAALAPVEKRIRIYEFKDIMRDIRWGWD